MASGARLAIAISQSGASGVEKALDGIAKSLGGLAHAASLPGKALGGLTDVLGKIGLAGMGISTIVQGVSSLASGMIAGNAEMERYEVQLGTLMGGADLARERLAELAKFGAETPFELPEIVRAEKVLLGFGLTGEKALKMTGHTATELRTILGDIAAGTGASFEEIALTWGKFSAGASGEAISRLQEMGVVTREQLTEMGITFSKSGELTSPLPKAMAAAVEIARKKFGGGMSALSQTFEGQMSTLADNWNMLVRTVAAPLFDALKPQIANLNAWLGSDGAQQLFKNVAGLLANVVTGAVNLAGQAFAAIGPTITKVMDTLANLGHFLSTGEIFEDAGFLYDFKDALHSIYNAVQPIIAVLPDMGTAISQAFGFFTTGSGDIEVFRGVLNRLLGPEGAQGVVVAFTNLTGFVQNDLIPAFQMVGSIVNKVISGDLSGALAQVGGIVKAVAPQIGAALVEWGRQFAAWVAVMWPPFQAELLRLGGLVAAYVVAEAPKIAAVLVGWGQEFIAWVAPMIPPLLAELGMMALRVLGWMGEQALALNVKAYSEWVPALVRWVGDVAPGVLLGLVQFQQQVGKWLRDDAVDWLLTDGAKLGLALIQGIWNGLDGQAQWLYKQIRGLLAGALDAAKSAIRAFSPSQVWAVVIGMPIVEGIIEGIKDFTPDLQETIELAIQPPDMLLDDYNNLADLIGDTLIDSFIGLGEKIEHVFGDAAQDVLGLIGRIQELLKLLSRVSVPSGGGGGGEGNPTWGLFPDPGPPGSPSNPGDEGEAASSRRGMAARGASVVINQTIDNRGNAMQAVATQTLDALARARLISGAV